MTLNSSTKFSIAVQRKYFILCLPTSWFTKPLGKNYLYNQQHGWTSGDTRREWRGGNHAVDVNGITFLNSWILFLLNFLFCFFHIQANSQPLNCWTLWCIMKIWVEKNLLFIYLSLYIPLHFSLLIIVDSSMRNRGQGTERLQNYWLNPLSVPISVL